MERWPERVEVLGAPIDPYTMAQTVEKIIEYVESGLFAHCIGVNSDKLLQMRDDAEMDVIVRRCEVVNADGASMVMAADKLGIAVPGRVAGIDLMLELCKAAERREYTVYLLGAKRDVVESTATVLRGHFPDLVICGIRDGYFGEEEYDFVAEEIRNLNPSFVFVGITSPKKERLIEFFRAKGIRGAFVGVGGSFDVISSTLPRAPRWMQQCNLEWLFRMLQEPRRLARRYLVGNVRFIRILNDEIRLRKKSA